MYEKRHNNVLLVLTQHVTRQSVSYRCVCGVRTENHNFLIILTRMPLYIIFRTQLLYQVLGSLRHIVGNIRIRIDYAGAVGFTAFLHRFLQLRVRRRRALSTHEGEGMFLRDFNVRGCYTYYMYTRVRLLIFTLTKVLRSNSIKKD